MRLHAKEARARRRRQRALPLLQWNRPLFLTSLDVDNAFAQVEPRAEERAMLHHQDMSAVLRELVGQPAWPMVGEVEAEEPIALGRGAKQGCICHPTL